MRKLRVAERTTGGFWEMAPEDMKRSVLADAPPNTAYFCGACWIHDGRRVQVEIRDNPEPGIESALVCPDCGQWVGWAVSEPTAEPTAEDS